MRHNEGATGVRAGNCFYHSHHEQTRPDAGKGAAHTELFGRPDQAGGDLLARQQLDLVDVGEHRVGGLRDERRGEAGDEAGAEVDGRVGGGGQGGALVDALVHGLDDLFVDDELGAGVRDPVGREGRHV